LNKLQRSNTKPEQPKSEKQSGVIVVTEENANFFIDATKRMTKTITTTNLAYTDKWTDS
jgi:hypothetical protein